MPGAGSVPCRAWRAAAVCVVAALLSALSAPRGRAAELAGAWLIEAEPFDAMVERGFDIASYPLLVIDDRSFRLYRMHVQCIPLDERGEHLQGAELIIETCYRIAEENARHGLGWGAWLLAEGRVEIAESRARFTAHSVAAEPEWGHRDAAAWIAQGRPRADVPPALWRFLEETHATWYTTFHAGDGAWMTMQLGAETLVLVRPDGRELRYRRSSAAAVTAAMSLLAAFELSGARYFRCMLRLVEGTQRGGPDRAALARMVALGAQAEARHARAPHAQLLRAGGRSAEADRVWSADDETRFAATAAAVAAGREGQALASREVAGRFLGCPERDAPS